MRARPTAWEPTTWAVITLGILFALLQLPPWVAPLVGAVAALGLICLPEEQRRMAEAIHRDSLRIVDIGIRQAARIMEMDPSDFEKALRGERKLDDWRLEMLPAEVKRVRAYLILKRHGLPELIKHALKIVPAVLDAERSA